MSWFDECGVLSELRSAHYVTLILLSDFCHEHCNSLWNCDLELGSDNANDVDERNRVYIHNLFHSLVYIIHIATFTRNFRINIIVLS